MTAALATSAGAALVRVVIVNFRTPALVVDCLASLAPEVAARPGTRVCVVDNASEDGSAEAIADAIVARGWAGWAELRRSPANGGYASGNNLAIGPALAEDPPPDLFWLLNPDTQVRAGSLAALTAFLDDHPDAGIVGSGFEDAEGQPWRYTFRFPTVLSELEGGARLGVLARLLQRRRLMREMGEEPALVEWVTGASMLVRRQVFEDVGLMDDGYFLYYEETDFCLQARRAGWACWYVPQGRVMHIVGQSTGVTSEDGAGRRLPAYWFESRRRYFLKNHGRLYAVLADVTWTLAHLSLRLRSRRWQGPPHLLSDFLRHSALIRGAGRG